MAVYYPKPSTPVLNRKVARRLGLVEAWPFARVAGDTTLRGLMGINGTLTNSPTWGTGPLGAMLSTNGSSSYVSIAHSDALNITSAITVFVRGKRRRDGTREIFLGKSNGGANSSFWMEFNSSNRCIFYLRQSTGIDRGLTASVASVTAGQEFTFVGTYDGAVQRLYLNGVQDPTTLSWAGSINAATSTLGIGRLGDFAALHGQIDFYDFRLYNRALTQNEITQLVVDPWAIYRTPRRVWAMYAPGAAFNPAWARNANTVIQGNIAL